MKRKFMTGVQAGIMAIAVVAFAAPAALAQGQGGVKTDSTAENPTTKSGTAAERARDTKGSNSGTMMNRSGNMGSGTTGASEAGSGSGAKGQGMGTPKSSNDPRANPDKPVAPR